MNRTLGIVLCSFVTCISVFASDASSPTTSSITSSTATSTDPLIVPPIRSWLRKVHESKEPEVITLIKNHVGPEPFHEIPAHQRMLSAHLESLMRKLNDDTVAETVAFLTLCQQKGIKIEYMASDDLFILAYHKRAARETVYKTNVEAQAGAYTDWPAKHVAQIKEEIEYHVKQAEQNATALGNICATIKARHEPTITAYTTIMQLTQKLNPQYAPAYATDSKKYYTNIEQEFTLPVKMRELAALAAHVQEITKLLGAVQLIGKVPVPVQSNTLSHQETVEAHQQEAPQTSVPEQPMSTANARSSSATTVTNMATVADQTKGEAQTVNSSKKNAREFLLNYDFSMVKATVHQKKEEEPTALDQAKPRLDTALQAKIMANLVQPSTSPTTSTTEQKQ